MSLCDINGKIIALSDDSAVLTHRRIENPNLADPASFEVGLLNANGTINTAQVGCATSPFYPVIPGQIISTGYITAFTQNPWFKATTFYEAYRAYVFFAEDKTTIVKADASTDYSQSNKVTGLTVPYGAAYVRVSWKQGAGYTYPNATPERYFLCVGDSPQIAPTYYFERGIEKTYIPAESVGYTIQPPYAGKKWVLFGDSLTDAYAGKGWEESTQSTGGEGWTKENTYVAWTGQLWASRIASELGLSIDNWAKSGSNINDGTNGNYTDVSGIRILDAYIAEVEAGTTDCADYITIGFGSNTRGDQIGTNEDTSETKTSVYGAMKYFIEKLRYLQKNYNQKMVFGFVLPPQSSWGEGNTRITEGRTAMLEVLNTDEYAVPYCDMWKESGICLDQMTDGIHVASIESNNLYYHAMRRFMMGL